MYATSSVISTNKMTMNVLNYEARTDSYDDGTSLNQGNSNFSGSTWSSLDINTSPESTTSPSGDRAAFHAPYLTAGVLISLPCPVIVFGNSLVIIAVLRHHHLHTWMHVTIANMSLADLLTALFGMPTYAIIQVGLSYFR